jgi:hypothetical protein
MKARPQSQPDWSTLPHLRWSHLRSHHKSSLAKSHRQSNRRRWAYFGPALKFVKKFLACSLRLRPTARGTGGRVGFPTGGTGRSGFVPELESNQRISGADRVSRLYISRGSAAPGSIPATLRVPASCLLTSVRNHNNSRRMSFSKEGAKDTRGHLGGGQLEC